MTPNDRPYEKIPFVWQEPAALVEIPERLTFRAVDHNNLDILVHAVGQAANTSLDRSDQKDTRDADPSLAAEAFIGSAKDHFDYQLSWWQLAFDPRGQLVGFVQPVIYRGCQRDGLEEGTIFYIGVVLEQRGKRYVVDLLRKGTRILQEIGVWRIYCDTDVLNTPMINAFQSVGYKQFGPPEEKPL